MIKRAAGFTSDFCVYVTVSDGQATVTGSFQVSAQSSAALRAASIGDWPANAATPAVAAAAITESPAAFSIPTAASRALDVPAAPAARLGQATDLAGPLLAVALSPRGVSDGLASLGHYASPLAPYRSSTARWLR